MKITIRLMAFFMTISVCFGQIDTAKQQRMRTQRLSMVQSESKNEPILYGDDYRKGYIDRFGNVKIPMRYVSADTFSQGFAVVWTTFEKCGYIDTNGNALTPQKYVWAKAFENGYGQAAVTNDNVVFVDKNGKESEIVSVGAYFRDNRAAMAKEGKIGYIDYSGKFVVAPIYDGAEPFGTGLATVQKQGLWGVIDTLGKEIVPCKYEYIALSFDKNEMCAFGINGKSGLMRLDGTILLEPKYDKIRNKFDDGFWIYTQNGLEGLISADGKVLTPPIYDGWNVGFARGHQGVRQNQLWGVIDKKGKTIAPCRYSGQVAFYHIKDDGSQQLAAAERGLAQIGRKFGIIDTLGNEVIPIIYDYVKPLGANPNHSPINCDVDFYAVYSNHLVGVVDKNGKIILPIAYEAINLGCNKTLFHIYKKRDELCGYATITGKILVEPSLKSVGCKYKEDKAITYKTRWGCEGVRGHPCDPIPLPCYQCEQECPDAEWLKAHGY